MSGSTACFRVVKYPLGLSLVFCLATLLPDVSWAQTSSASMPAFRNALHAPPSGWNGPVFELSDDYPTEHPGDCPETECTWLALDVDFSVDFDAPPPDWYEGKWDQYIARILDYVKEGQDPQLSNDVGFQVDVGGETRWFHVPWMAYDPTAGREFIHGTTNERTAHLSDFLGNGRGMGVHTLPSSDSACEEEFPHGFETWAVGVYNQWGGYSIGQVFPKSGVPAIGSYMGSPMPVGLPFSEGTVVAKFLTTNAPPKCVPYLEGSPEWQVHRHAITPRSREYACFRRVQVSRLAQVDVAVIDERSPTRWVYGTFGYSAEAEGDTVWDRLVPVGIQWGSDPWTFPAVPESESIPARQSVLNPDIGIYEHFGCRGRLAGPVDNPMSSCMSCHGSAYAAPNGAPSVIGTNSPPAFGFDGMCTNYSQDNQNYFANVVPPMGYSGGQFPNNLSLDTSLQLLVAFTQYGYFNTDGQPQACTDPNQF